MHNAFAWFLDRKTKRQIFFNAQCVMRNERAWRWV